MVSNEQLIEDLQEFAEELGRTPTAREMNEDGQWDSTTYQKHFGSWNNALDKAELSVNKNVSRERLISGLQKFAKELGRTPTKREMEEDGPWNSTTYQKHFGSWNNALNKAGLSVNKEFDISRERLISDLQEFAKELGKAPTKGKMKEGGPWDSKTYQKYFGSWNNALDQAGLEINRLPISELAGTGEDYYGENWYKKRRETVERDVHACRVCGNDGSVHVHHIKPRRKFDDVSNSNTLDNLITLCPSCHGRFEGRWQNATPDEFAKRAKDLYVGIP
jgi:hypothetical protein